MNNPKSEKIFYQKVRDIHTLSIDYEPKTDITKKIFATIQNKLHWAVHQTQRLKL